MNDNMFLEITKAEYLEEYKLRVAFNNGEQKTVDFHNLLFMNDYPVFRPLRDKENFRRFVVTDTLEWENNTIDIAPETVYEMSENDIIHKVAEPTVIYRKNK